MSRKLTVGKLKEIAGTDYEAINELVRGRPEDQIIDRDDLLLRTDYTVRKLLSGREIRDALVAEDRPGRRVKNFKEEKVNGT
ncbi:MAG: hypothetical protein LUC17_02315 [Oscillospiraceae bacterium]|nr:hypothetical protein [Oscillospiraceae bacterium]